MTPLPSRRSAASAELAAQAGPPIVDGIRVGVGGWTFAPWRDNFYPAALVQRRELEYASRKLTAIEINGTFYGTQKPATYAKWAQQTPPGFLFSAKAPRRIVQAGQLATTGPQVDGFLAGLAALGDRLGPVVWQFDQRALERGDFTAFLDLIPSSLDGLALRHVIDMREPGFFDHAFVELIRQRGMASVFTDSTEHPSFADVSTDFVYARLMRSRSALVTGYERAELAQWAARARRWASGDEPDDLPRLAAAGESRQGNRPLARRDVFVFFIGAAKERNPAAAMALIEELGRR